MKPIALAAALSICATPLWAQNKMTLLLDWFVNPDHGAVIVAQERGFFADVDLEVEIIAPANPSDPPKLVAAGQAQMVISYQPQLHLQIHEGLPLQRVGIQVATPLNCLLVLDYGPIASPADLKGRKVGFSVGGVEEAVLGHVLNTLGLRLEYVELINVNWSLSPSLMSGQVYAVIGAFRNFELNQMVIEGVPGHCFYVEEEGLPPYDELIYIANPNTMDADVVRRFLSAAEKATQHIINHPQESWEMFSGTAPELQDELNRRAWADTLPRFALRPAAVDVGRYANFESFLFKAALIPSINHVSDIAIDVVTQ